MKHRGRRNRKRVVVATASAVTSIAVLGLPFLGSDRAEKLATKSPPLRQAAALVAEPLSAPTSRPRPTYLRRAYRAPESLVRAGAGGELRIPSLGVAAPVDAVGLDGTAMAIPNDPARIGWLTTTARADDVVGSSVLAGHVSDGHDRPGALHGLVRIKLGATITWITRNGQHTAFRVVRVRIVPRARGLPAQTFSTASRRELNLVTCAVRVATRGGGFHYTSNLVVTAVRQLA